MKKNHDLIFSENKENKIIAKNGSVWNEGEKLTNEQTEDEDEDDDVEDEEEAEAVYDDVTWGHKESMSEREDEAMRRLKDEQVKQVAEKIGEKEKAVVLNGDVDLKKKIKSML